MCKIRICLVKKKDLRFQNGNNDLVDQKNYKVIFFDKICDLDNCMSNFDFVEYKYDFPIKKEFKLKFELDNEFVNSFDITKFFQYMTLYSYKLSLKNQKEFVTQSWEALQIL